MISLIWVGYLRPGMVHRIDKDTSGLVVVAKNNTSYHMLRLGEQFSVITLLRENTIAWFGECLKATQREI